MGRKPVLGLVGACLASVALAGCCNNCTWPGGAKKDTTSAATGSNSTAWNNRPHSSQTGSPGQLTASAAGSSSTASTPAGGTGGSGAFGSGGSGPANTYPEGRSMLTPAGGTDNISRVSYPASSGAEPNGGRSPATTASAPGDANTGGLPPVTGTPAAGGAGSALLPLGSSGTPSRPRMDGLPAGPTSRAPAVTPAQTTGSGGTTSALPPPALPPSDPTPPAAGASASLPDLPPIPAPPVPPSTAGLQSRPLPPAPPPLPHNTGIPTSTVGNPAVMPSGGGTSP